MRKGSSELVSMLWLRMTAYDAQSSVRQLERLNAAIAQSRLEIPIAAVFSLDDVARADERVESGHLIGKVVLNISLGRSA